MLICGKCNKEITGNAVLSPSLDESKRVRCTECAMQDMEKMRPLLFNIGWNCYPYYDDNDKEGNKKW